MRAGELDYDLPAELIAQEPLPERDESRLLVVSRKTGRIEHATVRDLVHHLPPGSLVVINDTAVIPARLALTKTTGGRIEVLLVERLTRAGSVERWSAMVRGAKSIKPGLARSIGELEIRFLEPKKNLWEVELSCDRGVERGLSEVGQIPLPPYIRRAAVEDDRQRYQTVFAHHPGAIAAPTAGLHLSLRLLEELDAARHQIAKITLHVGPGTFAPLRSEELAEHVMHAERYNVPPETSQAIHDARAEGRPIVAVGTTVVRTLESAFDQRTQQITSGEGRSALFIYPPYAFRALDHGAMLTNFHLPRSTLLALVMAFGGVELIRAAYAAAIERKYRFFSYGDAMLLV